MEEKQGNADEFVSPVPLLCFVVNYEAFYITVWSCHALIRVDALCTVISRSSWLSLLTFLLRVVNGKEAGLSHRMLIACKGAGSEQATGSWWEEGIEKVVQGVALVFRIKNLVKVKTGSAGWWEG